VFFDFRSAIPRALSLVQTVSILYDVI
jgi:hypothetical protein